MRCTRTLGVGALTAALLLLAGCQASPQAVAPGEYNLFATSEMTSPAADARLAVKDQVVTIESGSNTWESTLGAPSQSVVLCPPSGPGAPATLGAPLTLGDLQLTRPAIFGDCGQTKPIRVTVVDLDSYNNGETRFPFTRWAEFCKTTDPDCL